MQERAGGVSEDKEEPRPNESVAGGLIYPRTVLGWANLTVEGCRHRMGQLLGVVQVGLQTRLELAAKKKC
jgi:hypothetical protein